MSTEKNTQDNPLPFTWCYQFGVPDLQLVSIARNKLRRGEDKVAVEYSNVSRRIWVGDESDTMWWCVIRVGVALHT